MNQIAKIREIHGDAIANYADRNLAGWVIEMLADDSMNPRGPFAGRRVCDAFMEGETGRQITASASGRAFSVAA